MTKLVLISDTHGKHDKIELPAGDILIHSGDITRYGGSDELRDFANWVEYNTSFKHCIIIGGNHDGAFERDPAKALRKLTGKTDKITYLQDSGCEIKGIKFWGSPFTRSLFKMGWWAFGAPDEVCLKFHWDKIPQGIDYLITHSPPRNYLDQVVDGHNVGSISLTAAIFDYIRPKYVQFGHIHESYGRTVGTYTVQQKPEGGNIEYPIQFINASIMNVDYEPVNLPQVVEI